MPSSDVKHSGTAQDTDVCGLTSVTLVAAIAGAIVGVVGGTFTWLLHASFAHAIEGVNWLRTHSVDWPISGGVIAVALVGLTTALARFVVRIAPSAAGSGIQHVEAVMRGDAAPAPLRVLPAKFVGGLLAMSTGLALGREGPTVQMAAIIGNSCASLFRFNAEDRSMLYTAVAGAGLAVAFNAPLAGAAFVIEEIARVATLRRMVVTLTAIGTSVVVFRISFGNDPQFLVTHIQLNGVTELLLMTLLGAALGLAGALYNRTVLLFLWATDRIPRVPPELIAAVIGMIVATVGWFNLHWIGSGEIQVQSILNGNTSLGGLVTLFAIRWLLGPLSYAASTPGGLFAPLLLLGASGGALFAWMCDSLVPGQSAAAFAMVGMAALFAGVVRAPLTGILLIVEMTRSVSLMAPLLLASVAAVVVASRLGSPPIYDTLRERMRTARTGG
jgi:CIC family chloride channel protein